MLKVFLKMNFYVSLLELEYLFLNIDEKENYYLRTKETDLNFIYINISDCVAYNEKQSKHFKQEV